MTIPKKRLTKKELADNVADVRRRIRRALRKPLREMEQRAAAVNIAVRLNIRPSDAYELAYGNGDVSVDQLSNLSCALGVELKLALREKRK